MFGSSWTGAWAILLRTRIDGLEGICLRGRFSVACSMWILKLSRGKGGGIRETEGWLDLGNGGENLIGQGC